MTSFDNNGITTSIYLDKRRLTKENKAPVKLRITYQRKSRLYKTGYFLTEEEFEKVFIKKKTKQYKEIFIKLTDEEKRARDILKKMPAFSFEGFKKYYLNTGNYLNVFEQIESYEKELRQESRVESANIYKNLNTSIKRFVNRESLKFSEITPDFLKKYEKWMFLEGRNETTIGMYLRHLRRIYNIAIKDGFAAKEEYPFLSDLYKIPEPKSTKKALSKSDLKKLFSYKPIKKDSEYFYYDLWLFSYLCNGINVKDICLLKSENIKGDEIYFKRAKTKGKNRSTKPIEILITKEVAAILKRWRNQQPDNDYIFPILKPGLTPDQIQKTVKQTTKQINKYIKRIATTLGIKQVVTSYTARHSFATILKNSGAPITFISESLGHTDIKTTQNYLDSFGKSDKKKLLNKLTNL